MFLRLTEEQFSRERERVTVCSTGQDGAEKDTDLTDNGRAEPTGRWFPVSKRDYYIRVNVNDIATNSFKNKIISWNLYKSFANLLSY